MTGDVSTDLADWFTGSPGGDMSDDLRERLYAVRVLLADSTVHLQDEDEILEARAAVADAIDLLAGTREFPILWEHDHTRPVGQYRDGGIDFLPRTVTHDLLPMGIGYRILESEMVDSVRYLRRVQLLELSVGANATLRASAPEAMPCPRCQRGDPCPDNDVLVHDGVILHQSWCQVIVDDGPCNCPAEAAQP